MAHGLGGVCVCLCLTTAQRC
uniref:Uncharacterized protein n=1 Tax=Rhizophora mucronata TaxID=61149 RepID=A0A2P2NCZ7_RHIMU